MRIENMTNKKEFLKAFESGFFEIEMLEAQVTGKKIYKISDNRFNTVSWILHKFENNYAIEYKGVDPFTVYCSMENNNIEIEHAIQNEKKYKADRFLKKFNHVCMFANCFVNFGLCN